mgnify:CR=1 FL=1
MKIRERKVLQGLIIISILVVMVISVFGDKGLLQLLALNQQEQELIEEIEELKVQRKEWIRKINSLKANDSYMETLAREELGMVRNNEMMIRLYYGDSFQPSPKNKTEE